MERQTSGIELEFPDGSTVHDLELRLHQMEINPEAGEIIISLSGRGLQQHDPGRLLENGEEVAVFPHIAGG
jgi:molybdopterin converting factor small subunit